MSQPITVQPRIYMQVVWGEEIFLYHCAAPCVVFKTADIKTTQLMFLMSVLETQWPSYV